MGWKCKKCGETSDKDDLTFPVMHEVLKGEGHECEPSIGTALVWGNALNVNDAFQNGRALGDKRRVEYSIGKTASG